MTVTINGSGNLSGVTDLGSSAFAAMPCTTLLR